MTNKFSLILGSLLMFCAVSFAQKNITLTVFVKAPKTDSATNITLQLYLLPDTVLTSTQAAKNGRADFRVQSFSKYLLKTSSVSFESTESIIGVTDKPANNSIVLKRKNTTLQNVVVVSRKPL
ncbi:MAG TPA: hypothetical protein VK484_07655, partial [Ferruginibacter sp.]|nr:hypothetical protein [Ferruginibacter sp.]